MVLKSVEEINLGVTDIVCESAIRLMLSIVSLSVIIAGV